MIERAIVSYDGGFAYHHAHAVVDEDAVAYASPRVYFNAGQPAGQVRAKTREPIQVFLPQEMRHAVH